MCVHFLLAGHLFGQVVSLHIPVEDDDDQDGDLEGQSFRSQFCTRIASCKRIQGWVFLELESSSAVDRAVKQLASCPLDLSFLAGPSRLTARRFLDYGGRSSSSSLSSSALGNDGLERDMYITPRDCGCTGTADDGATDGIECNDDDHDEHDDDNYDRNLSLETPLESPSKRSIVESLDQRRGRMLLPRRSTEAGTVERHRGNRIMFC